MWTDRNDEANSHCSQFFERVKNSINTQKQNTKQTKQGQSCRKTM